MIDDTFISKRGGTLEVHPSGDVVLRWNGTVYQATSPEMFQVIDEYALSARGLWEASNGVLIMASKNRLVVVDPQTKRSGSMSIEDIGTFKFYRARWNRAVEEWYESQPKKRKKVLRWVGI